MKRKTHFQRTDVTAILIEKADHILTRLDTVLLTSDEYSFFLDALAEDRKPSKRSRAAARRYQGDIVKA